VLVIDLFSGNFANAHLYILYEGDMRVLYAIARGQIRPDTLEKIDLTDESDFRQKCNSYFFLPYFLILELYHGNPKTIRAVKEAADHVAALVPPKMIHNAMVNIQKAADICVKQSISTISTFALIAKVGKTDQLPKTSSNCNVQYISCCCVDFRCLNCIQNFHVSSIRYIN
jgi:hypothetical protein